MPIKIVVPELGESIVEATVAEWLKKEGDRVAAGEALVKLETDKVDLEVAAERAGVLAHIEQAAGSDVKVGDVLATLDEGDAASGEATGQAEAAAKGGVEGRNGKAQASDAPAMVAPEGAPDQRQELDAAQAKAAETAGAETAGSEAETSATQGKEAGEIIRSGEEKATPVARRMAQDLGVDVSQVRGTGAQGRVTKDDLEGYLQAQEARPASAAQAAAPARPATAAPAVQPGPAAAPAPAPQAGQTGAIPGSGGSSQAGRAEERVRMSRRRQTIATRLVEAQHPAAMLTTFNEIDMSAVMDVRKRRRDSFKERWGIGLGFMSFFVKASIGALRAFPRLNAEIQGNEFVLKHYYDIGIAIGAAEGLVVPVLRDADRLSFAAIEKAIKDFAAKVESGTLSLEDLRGGTFTLTNGGVFGSLMSTPILNPPQVGILGMHKIQERPVAINREVQVRPMMYVALSYDHRIVDGREAVQFLVRVKELVEDPETLLLEG
jgi:2-oxoglutarate dehydrogenase E2 component (dihydrolipoamide succinyltransferase)